jgi:hypothetical protein
VRHHRTGDTLLFDCVAIATGTGTLRHTIVTGIDKTDVLPTLAGQQRIASFRICASHSPVAFPFVWKARLHVRFAFRAIHFFWIVARFSCCRIATMTSGAG